MTAEWGIQVGLFDRFKKSDGSTCPYCDAKDVSPATPAQAEGVTGDGDPYICNYCGRVFFVKPRR